MTRTTTTSSLALVPSLETAWQDVDSSFERFCLTAVYRARFFGHKFDLSGVLHFGFLPVDTRLTRAA